MPLNHEKATAKVSVTGLALSCFNPATRNWEVALIRQPDHTLRIRVNKILPGGKSSQATFEIDDQHKLFITADKVIAQDQPLFMQEPFDRKNPAGSHPEDIRWIVDFEREFNNGQPVNLTKPDSVTELIVSEPVLYADKDRKRVDMKLVNLQNNTKEDFGTFAEVCNADISCNEGGGVTLRVEGPLGFSMDLPYVKDRTHVIRIENDCSQPAVIAKGEEPPPTDFRRYFDFVKLPDEAKFDVQRKNPDGEGSDAVCNPGHLGSTTKLLPL